MAGELIDLPETAKCSNCGAMIYLEAGVWLRVDREGDEVGDLCALAPGEMGEYKTHAP